MRYTRLVCPRARRLNTIRIVARLRHQDGPAATLLQLLAVCLLLQCRDWVKVLERRGAWDMLEVAVLEDAQRHLADTPRWAWHELE